VKGNSSPKIVFIVVLLLY